MGCAVVSFAISYFYGKLIKSDKILQLLVISGLGLCLFFAFDMILLFSNKVGEYDAFGMVFSKVLIIPTIIFVEAIVNIIVSSLNSKQKNM